MFEETIKAFCVGEKKAKGNKTSGVGCTGRIETRSFRLSCLALVGSSFIGTIQVIVHGAKDLLPVANGTPNAC